MFLSISITCSVVFLSLLIFKSSSTSSLVGSLPNILALSLRSFSDNQKRETYERQKGICPKCTPPNNHYEIHEMQGDHITPWSKGGKTIADNCKMLCSKCNREKSNI